jgi:hypothetical protein
MRWGMMLTGTAPGSSSVDVDHCGGPRHAHERQGAGLYIGQHPSSPRPRRRTSGPPTLRVRAIHKIGWSQGLTEKDVDDRCIEVFGAITPFLTDCEYNV